jgi:hypothetical protein
MSTEENEAGEDILPCETGHIPSAVKLDWHSDVPGSPDRAHPERMGTLTSQEVWSHDALGR